METAEKNLARGSPSYLDAHYCSRRKICAIKHREKKHLRRPPNLQAGVGPKSTSERHERPRGAVGDGRRAARRDPARFGRFDRYLRAPLGPARRVQKDSAVTAYAAAVVARALGTGARSGSHGRGRLPGPPAGCAGLACQARSRAVPCGARRGPGWPCVESASDAPFLVPVSVFVVRILFPGSSSSEL